MSLLTSSPKITERLQIENDISSPNNILFYVFGFLVSSLLSKLHCVSCKSKLLLDRNNCYALNMSSFPFYAKFAVSRQKGGLVFPSVAVLKIVKATEVILEDRLLKMTLAFQKKNILIRRFRILYLSILGLPF